MFRRLARGNGSAGTADEKTLFAIRDELTADDLIGMADICPH
jgi:hypothetical protein